MSLGLDDDPELERWSGPTCSTRVMTSAACDVKQLEARLEIQRPDLLVLDLMMPGDDGLTALRRLRDAGDDLPVVMLTARARPLTGSSALNKVPTTTWASPSPRNSRPVLKLCATTQRHARGHPGGRGRPGELRRERARFVRTHVVQGWRAGGDHQWRIQSARLIRATPPSPLSRDRLIELARGPGCDTDSRSMDVQISRVRKLVEPIRHALATSRRFGVRLRLCARWRASFQKVSLRRGWLLGLTTEPAPVQPEPDVENGPCPRASAEVLASGTMASMRNPRRLKNSFSSQAG